MKIVTVLQKLQAVILLTWLWNLLATGPAHRKAPPKTWMKRLKKRGWVLPGISFSTKSARKNLVHRLPSSVRWAQRLLQESHWVGQKKRRMGTRAQEPQKGKPCPHCSSWASPRRNPADHPAWTWKSSRRASQKTVSPLCSCFHEYFFLTYLALDLFQVESSILFRNNTRPVHRTSLLYRAEIKIIFPLPQQQRV